MPAAIHAEVDGVAALETVRELGRFHRVQGSPGFAAAAEHHEAESASRPASPTPRSSASRPTARRSTRTSSATSAGTRFRPRSRRSRRRSGSIAAFPDLPVALADYSQDADVTAEPGGRRQGHVREGLRGQGRPRQDRPRRRRAARRCTSSPARSAAPWASCPTYPNQTTAWSGDDRDLVRWGHLSPYQPQNRFAFMLSKRQAEDFRARLAAGEKIVLRARVVAKMVPATYDVVVAHDPRHRPRRRRGRPDRAPLPRVRGRQRQRLGQRGDPRGGARARVRRSASRRFPRPARTIRFLWLPEIAGSQAYLVRHPEIVRRLVAGVHMDMVGGLLATTKGTFHLSRTAETLPHVANEIAAAWFDEVVAASVALRRAGRRRATPASCGRPGSREMFLGDVRALEHGQRPRGLRGGGLSACRWSTSTTGPTSRSTPRRTSPRTSTRPSSAASPTWAPASPTRSPRCRRPRCRALLALDARGRRRERIARAGAAAGADAALVRREAVVYRHRDPRVGRAPVAVDRAGGRRRRRPPARDCCRPRRRRPTARVPMRNPEIRGPLDVYYYDYFADIPGADFSTTALAGRDDGDILAYEALQPRRRQALGLRDPRHPRGPLRPRSPAGDRRVLRPARPRPAPSPSRREDRADRVDRLLGAAEVARRDGDRDRPADARPRRAGPRRHALRLGRFADHGAAPRRRAARHAGRSRLDVLPRARASRSATSPRRTPWPIASTSCTRTGPRRRPTSRTRTTPPDAS